jgi:hypothetical protein
MSLDAGNSTFDAAIHTIFDVSQGFALDAQTGNHVVLRAQSQMPGNGRAPRGDS